MLIGKYAQARLSSSKSPASKTSLLLLRVVRIVNYELFFIFKTTPAVETQQKNTWSTSEMEAMWGCLG